MLVPWRVGRFFRFVQISMSSWDGGVPLRGRPKKEDFKRQPRNEIQTVVYCVANAGDSSIQKGVV